MSESTKDTLIIGAGISGLACAHTLCKAGASFTIIAEDLGGRIRASADGAVNYGAALVSDDYDHVLPFVTRGERVRMRDLYFHRDGPAYPLSTLGSLRYGSQALRLWRELRRFRAAYRSFRHRAEHASEKEAIQSDPYLLELYHKRASDLVSELRITELCHRFLCQGLHPLVFATPADINAFLYLHFLQPLIVPMYTFTFDASVMSAPFADRITRGTVSTLAKVDGGYRITGTNGVHHARQVIVATPVDVSARLLGFDRRKRGVGAYVIHVRGRLRVPFQRGRSHLFHPPETVYGFLVQRDGTVVVYSREAAPDFDRFFETWDVIAQVHWDPAEFTIGHELLEAKRDDGLYVIGDHNVGGLEASFITGVYAANQILAPSNAERSIAP